MSSTTLGMVLYWHSLNSVIFKVAFINNCPWILLRNSLDIKAFFFSNLHENNKCGNFLNINTESRKEGGALKRGESFQLCESPESRDRQCHLHLQSTKVPWATRGEHHGCCSRVEQPMASLTGLHKLWVSRLTGLGVSRELVIKEFEL